MFLVPGSQPQLAALADHPAAARFVRQTNRLPRVVGFITFFAERQAQKPLQAACHAVLSKIKLRSNQVLSRVVRGE